VRVAAAKPLADVLEKEFELQVIGTAAKPGLARMLGWRVYHTLRSKGSQAGYPDWTLVRERVVFLELKREQGVVSPAQRDWLRALLDAGAEVYVVRPRHLDAIAKVLAARPRDAAPYIPFKDATAVVAQSELLIELGKELDSGND
jgi:hypothetical protein